MVRFIYELKLISEPSLLLVKKLAFSLQGLLLLISLINLFLASLLLLDLLLLLLVELVGAKVNCLQV